MIVLAFAFIIFLTLAIYNVWRIQDLWWNLCADALTVSATLLVIDFLLEKRRERDWREVEKSAQIDLNQLKNMLISYISNPFGENVVNYEPRTGETIKDKSEDCLEQILEKMEKIVLSRIDYLNIKQWQHMELNLMFIKPAISDYLSVYQRNLPSNVLGKLLNVRRKFNSYHLSFGLLSDLLTKEESQWPENNGGVKQSRQIRATMLDDHKKYLLGYFRELKNLVKVIRKWETK